MATSLVLLRNTCAFVALLASAALLYTFTQEDSSRMMACGIIGTAFLIAAGVFHTLLPSHVRRIHKAVLIFFMVVSALLVALLMVGSELDLYSRTEQAFIAWAAVYNILITYGISLGNDDR